MTVTRIGFVNAHPTQDDIKVLITWQIISI